MGSMNGKPYFKGMYTVGSVDAFAYNVYNFSRVNTERPPDHYFNVPLLCLSQ